MSSTGVLDGLGFIRENNEEGPIHAAFKKKLIS
jgi:hypothetical protein